MLPHIVSISLHCVVKRPESLDYRIFQSRCCPALQKRDCRSHPQFFCSKRLIRDDWEIGQPTIVIDAIKPFWHKLAPFIVCARHIRKQVSGGRGKGYAWEKITLIAGL